MSSIKNQINEQERKFRYALELAIESGVLINCPYHEGFIYLGNEQIESAYKLANSKWTSGKINPDHFETRKEMTNCIKTVVSEYGLYSCNQCRDLINK